MTLKFLDAEQIPEPEWRNVWRDDVAELRTRPGEWAELAAGMRPAERAYCAANYLRRKYGLQAKVRKQSDGSGWKLFAMCPETS